LQGGIWVNKAYPQIKILLTYDFTTLLTLHHQLNLKQQDKIYYIKHTKLSTRSFTEISPTVTRMMQYPFNVNSHVRQYCGVMYLHSMCKVIGNKKLETK
jgi:hypothetical protein